MNPLNRQDLTRLFGNDMKAILAFEQIQRALAANIQGLTANVGATEALQDATVLSLSPNASLSNERVLALGEGLTADDNGPGNAFVLALAYLIVLNGGFACTFNQLADTNLTLPATGTVATTDLGGNGPYANDAAAAADGVAVGEMYLETGGAVVWRQV